MKLLELRDRLISKIIHEEVTRYLSGKYPKRSCATCGKRFHPRQRWHFFCRLLCRKMWYRGQFRPRD